MFHRAFLSESDTTRQVSDTVTQRCHSITTKQDATCHVNQELSFILRKESGGTRRNCVMAEYQSTIWSVNEDNKGDVSKQRAAAVCVCV